MLRGLQCCLGTFSLLLLVLGLAPACSKTPSQNCVLDRDCQAPTPKCFLGRCSACAADSDCPANQSCRVGVCAPNTPSREGSQEAIQPADTAQERPSSQEPSSTDTDEPTTADTATSEPGQESDEPTTAEAAQEITPNEAPPQDAEGVAQDAGGQDANGQETTPPEPQCVPKTTRPCYEGDSSTQGVGLCKAGTQTCNTASQWGACTGQVLPAKGDPCDSKDNNCDGKIDEGCPCTEGSTRPCGTDVGLCRKGTQSCLGSIWLACTGETKPSTEACDDKDNDCDGSIDENLTRSCTTSCGTGQQTCNKGSWSKCSSSSGSSEVCDQKDNDCDGLIDEGCQCGECKSDADCRANGKIGVCSTNHCYFPCITQSDCPRGFQCNRVSGTLTNFCTPPIPNGGGQTEFVWFCSNYLRLGAPCSSNSVCGSSNSSTRRGGTCNKGKCTTYCRSSGHCLDIDGTTRRCVSDVCAPGDGD